MAAVPQYGQPFSCESDSASANNQWSHKMGGNSTAAGGRSDAAHVHVPDLDRVDAMVDIFDSRLRYHGQSRAGPGSVWSVEGRERFRNLVHRAAWAGARIEFCLPAFPCKSANPLKVAGPLPDRGEELALSRLHDFVCAVAEVYAPGARLTIVSDGFVFGDLVGRDDDDVAAYAEKLDAMNDVLARRRSGSEGACVRFFPMSRMLAALAQAQGRGEGEEVLAHPLRTRTTKSNELARSRMMAAFGGSRADLRRRIESGKDEDKSELARYRGEIRFMLDDLAGHDQMTLLSRKAKKRLAADVAFEMMMRNDAHSRLVETMFPRHIRLSVHAHDDTGPKFPIDLFGPDVALTGQPDAAGTLHIATPWHNCIVDIPGQGLTVARSSAVRRFADWKSGSHQLPDFQSEPRPMGGYFVLGDGNVTVAEMPPKVLKVPTDAMTKYH